MKELPHISLGTRLSGPPIAIALTALCFTWLLNETYGLLITTGHDVIAFDKTPFYMLGPGLVFAYLSFVVVKEYWFRAPISNKQGAYFKRTAMIGFILAILIPNGVHFALDHYWTGVGYIECAEASTQVRLARSIIYVTEPTLCSEDLKDAHKW